jgi:hypothetical protein
MKSRALVLNANGLNLDALNVGWLGVFIAPTTKVVVGEGCCRMAHRTVRCASHVTQPLGFDHWSFDLWGAGQSGGAPDRSCRLFGTPSGACSDFCACRRALFAFTVHLQVTVSAK